jgi:hypothetical protein
MKHKASYLLISLLGLSLLSCGNENSTLLNSASNPEKEVSSTKEEIQVKVYLDSKGASLNEDEITLIYQQPYSLPVPEATAEMGNVVFEGWYYNNVLVETSGDSFPYDREVTLVARFENQDFTFRLNSDNTYTVIKNNSNSRYLSIPSLYNGLPVTRINKNVFSYDNHIVSVNIPSTVTEIGENSFYHCSKLKVLTFTGSVKSIGYCAFDSCKNLKKVYFDGELKDYLSIEMDEGSSPCLNKASLYLNNVLLTQLEIPSTVTSIKDYAFQGVTSIESVSIPSSVTSIGSMAFYHCSSLKNVTMDDSVTQIGSKAFMECYGLESISLSSVLNEIPSSCFKNCYHLTQISFPTDIKTISENAFESCRGLTSLSLPDKLETISNCAFKSCSSITSITFPDTLTSIGNQAFAYNSSLLGLSLGKNVTLIGLGTFATTPSLESIQVDGENLTYKASGNTLIEISDKKVIQGCRNSILPDDVLILGSQCFFGCYYLTDITLPGSLTTIEDYVFANCSKLSSLTIGKNVTSIGNNVLTGCGGLLTLIVDEENPNYSSITNCLLSKDKKTLIYGCTGSIIPLEVETISKEAFYYSSITEVNIPSGVKYIQERAFSHCYDLSKVSMADSVESILDGCFSYCIELSDVSLSSSLESIPASCFANCYFLSSLTIREGVRQIEDEAFRLCLNLDSLSLPSTLTSLGQACFLEDDIDEITISSANTNFVSEEHMLLDKSKKKLFYSSKNVTLPSTLEEIMPYALYGNDWIESLVLPSSMKIIHMYGCSNMNGLTSIVLPSSLNELEDNAFSDCSKLSEILYSSTSQDFSKIKIGIEVFSDTDAEEVITTDGSVRLGEKYFS